MQNQETFFSKFNIDKEAFDKTGLLWTDLEKIFDDFNIYREELEPTAILLFNKLMKSSKVHSVRYRVKDAEHLIEKIIRKKIENQNSNITLDNYKEVVTDLIGLRALHLFKDEWENINDFIFSIWNYKQNPIANYRKGDTEELIEFFKKKGCEPKEHKYGYRSVHYIIETQPGKQKHYAEIQVRTIYEEAWAEIDHRIRYPYDLENPIFLQYLLILNRLSGSADEMGSFIQLLKADLQVREEIFKNQILEKDALINDLETKIEKLNLQENAELLAVKEDLKKLKAQKIKGTFFDSNIFDVQKEYLKTIKPFEPFDKIKSSFDYLENINKVITVNPLKDVNYFSTLNKTIELTNPLKNLESLSSLNKAIELTKIPSLKIDKDK